LPQRDRRQSLAANDVDYGGCVALELVSDRLLLRPTEMRDLEFYFELRNGPEILALPGRQPSQRSDVERQLQRWLERWRARGFGTWTVFERRTEVRLGRVELDPIGAGWSHLGPDEIELGCMLIRRTGIKESRPRRPSSRQ
jgi:RimJ/RimL family protein N-acetyltransferase